MSTTQSGLFVVMSRDSLKSASAILREGITVYLDRAEAERIAVNARKHDQPGCQPTEVVPYAELLAQEEQDALARLRRVQETRSSLGGLPPGVSVTSRAARDAYARTQGTLTQEEAAQLPLELGLDAALERRLSSIQPVRQKVDPASAKEQLQRAAPEVERLAGLLADHFDGTVETRTKLFTALLSTAAYEGSVLGLGPKEQVNRLLGMLANMEAPGGTLAAE